MHSDQQSLANLNVAKIWVPGGGGKGRVCLADSLPLADLNYYTCDFLYIFAKKDLWFSKVFAIWKIGIVIFSLPPSVHSFSDEELIPAFVSLRAF